MSYVNERDTRLNLIGSYRGISVRILVHSNPTSRSPKRPSRRGNAVNVRFVNLYNHSLLRHPNFLARGSPAGSLSSFPVARGFWERHHTAEGAGFSGFILGMCFRWSGLAHYQRTASLSLPFWDGECCSCVVREQGGPSRLHPLGAGLGIRCVAQGHFSRVSKPPNP